MLVLVYLVSSILWVQSALAASIGGGAGSGGSSEPAPDSWPSVNAGDAVFANTLSNALCIGDGANAICIYIDPTLGGVIRPKTDSNTGSLIWTDKTWSMFDVEGNKDVFIVDPDAIALGSGTMTMQTGEQFVASNLGIKFTPSDTNPTCTSGVYAIYADTSEASAKLCSNGVPYTIPKEVILRKLADQTVTNSTTLVSDTALTFPAAANTVYRIRLFLIYDSATAADFNYNFSIPAGATGFKATHSTGLTTTICAGGSDTFAYNSITQQNSNVGGAGTGTANSCSMLIDGTVIIAGTAGNVTFQWAQATADATNTVVRTNSWLSYEVIP